MSSGSPPGDRPCAAAQISRERFEMSSALSSCFADAQNLPTSPSAAAHTADSAGPFFGGAGAGVGAGGGVFAGVLTLVLGGGPPALAGGAAPSCFAARLGVADL